MTTPVRFWRISFRSVNTYNYGQLIFRSLKPFDANGQLLVQDATLSISAGLMNATAFPLAHLVDEDDAAPTVCGVNYPDYRTTTAWRFVQFSYPEPVLWDYLVANISETALNSNSVVPANSVDFCIDSSPDNVTWNRQAMVYRPVLAPNADTKFSATTKSTTYPIPSRINIGGSGGIYGIVSEDGVPPLYSGYMAEVEADNPVYYFRMNELQSQRPINALGHQDYLAWFEGNPVFNAPGFVAGTSAITTSNGCLLINNFSTLASTFTVECFVRPSAVTGTTRIWLLRIYNGNPPMYLSLVGGNLQLSIVDVTGTTTTVFFAHPNLVVGSAYHLAVTYDPWQEKKTRLYIDGVQADEQTATVFPDTYRTATWLCIGANASATAPSISERFQGQIGEFAAYNYVLPPARVQAHFEARHT